jgi:hypothetical protein
LNAEFNADCPGSLFWNGTLDELLQSQTKALCDEIDGLGDDSVINADLQETARGLADKYTLEPVKLDRDKTETIARGETTISEGQRCLILLDPGVLRHSAAGTFYRVATPFAGDARLFMRRPSEYDTRLPSGEIVGNELHILCKTASRDPAFIQSGIRDNLDRVERWLDRANAEVTPFNARLTGLARDRLQNRKENLIQDNAIVQGLGFPVRARAGAPTTYEVPVHRKELPVIVASSTKTAAPDPHLDLAAYENILQTIASMGRVLELSPTAFARMGEEALRFVLLVPLNIHYEGQATGETFNFQGKSDIIIKVGAKNIFIAECLIWDGPDYFSEKIDQLLAYASWRDTKTSIVVFNRNKNLSWVLAQIPARVKAHPNFRREDSSYKSETGFRFVLHHRDDKDRHLLLTVLVFDVPS